ncbi:helicase-exonuclease AddAB subunit AddB [Ectobacillus polymachus]|uniref:helicase-exonuclease AddAB subunit AddB n=1 Tax=Ectobacillus polymachus TaxID=1508806 RepID=UPI003A8A192B
MSLRFIIGRAGSGKSETVLSEIQSELQKSPKGASILYLVPDQMTFQAQQALHHKVRSSIRAQVFSFSRLAWRVLQEVGGSSRLHIDGAGVNMLLRKIVEARKGELTVFQKASDQNGFFDQLSAMIAEWKRHNVTPSDIYSLSQELDGSKQMLLANKLHDLQLLYEDFERALVGKYLDGEDYIQLLIEKIPESQYVKQAEVYVDGFHTFLPQEIDVLKQLLRNGCQVTVTLTIDQVNEAKDELHLFYQTWNTYDRLLRAAKEIGIQVEAPIILTGQARFQSSRSLAHLEKNYDVRPYPYFGETPDITLLAAANRRAEVETIAREIRELVRSGYRYRDIAVMVRNGDSYYDVIQTMFQDYNIPYFIDKKRSMLHHPLIELIRSSFDVIRGNWRYDAVFRCVKTELLYPLRSHTEKLREDMDEFENYCLSYGIQGSRWTSEVRWTYRRYRSLDGNITGQTDYEKTMEDKINSLRDMIAKPILTLKNRLKRAKSVLSMCEAVYLYLEELQIPKKLEVLRKKEEEKGNFLFAKDHEQVWDEVIHLFDTFVEMLGNEKLSLDMFTQVVSTGLESLQFANIPPSLDQVLIANIDTSRVTNISALFFIGVNEGVIPAAPADEGVLSDEERELLLQSGMQLASTSRQALLEEQFLIYETLTKPSHKLMISCPFADEEGKTLLASSLFKKIRGMFPLVHEAFVTNDVNDVPKEEQLSFVETPAATLTYVTQQLQTWKRYRYESDLAFWWDVYNFFVTNDAWKEQSKRVFSSLFYRNEARKLDQSISKELYGDEIIGSVSRMELFQRCSYAHFIQYGLGLRERDIFRMEAPDMGELFHAALKNIADQLLAHKRSWGDLTKKECEHLAEETIETLAPLLQKEILLSSNRHHYLKRKLQQIIYRASVVLSEQEKASGFVPVALEVPFGMGNGALPPVALQLNNGTNMKIVGRIDRVDRAEGDQGTFLRIIDYKSSSKVLDIAEVYYGLSLQMLTYLDVVVENAKQWIVSGKPVQPAGVLYFHIHNPIIEVNKNLSELEIEHEIVKQFKMKGLMLAEREVMQLMDKTLETGSSHIVSASLKKDGSFYSNSSVASLQQFDVLQNHVHRKFEVTGNNITDGIIGIDPYKIKNKTACAFCQFRSICQFDESLKENSYRLLTPLKSSEALEKMSEEVSNHDNDSETGRE